MTSYYPVAIGVDRSVRSQRTEVVSIMEDVRPFPYKTPAHALVSLWLEVSGAGPEGPLPGAVHGLCEVGPRPVLVRCSDDLWPLHQPLAPSEELS